MFNVNGSTHKNASQPPQVYSTGHPIAIVDICTLLQQLITFYIDHTVKYYNANASNYVTMTADEVEICKAV